MKLCGDCMWCENPTISYSQCLHDSAMLPTERDVVTGKTVTVSVVGNTFAYCSTHRLKGHISSNVDKCGPGAKHFKPRKDAHENGTDH